MFIFVQIERLNWFGLGVFTVILDGEEQIYCVPNTRVNQRLWVQLTYDRFEKKIAKAIYAFEPADLPALLEEIQEKYLSKLKADHMALDVIEEAKDQLKLSWILTQRQKAMEVCPWIWDCPGCSFVDFSLKEQQLAQQQSHIASLSRITGLTVSELDHLVTWKQGSQSQGYRAKLSAKPILINSPNILGTKASMAIRFGILDRWEKQLIPLGECVVQNPQSRAYLNELTLCFNQALQQDETGLLDLLACLKMLVIYAIQDQVILIIVHHEHLPVESTHPLLILLTNILPKHANSAIYTQLSASHTKKSFPILKLTGIDPYYEDPQEQPYLAGQRLRFYFTPPSWISQNPSSIPALRAVIDELLDQKQELISCVEFGCGVGILTLWIAPRVARILGVDIVYSAILDAQKNAQFHGLTQAKFRCADAKKIVPKLKKEAIFDQQTTLVVIHAMRAELHPLLEQISTTFVTEVLYFAPCAASLARDLAAAMMWEIKKLYLIDQMPGTAQAMVVAWLIKRKENIDVLL